MIKKFIALFAVALMSAMVYLAPAGDAEAKFGGRSFSRPSISRSYSKPSTSYSKPAYRAPSRSFTPTYRSKPTVVHKNYYSSGGGGGGMMNTITGVFVGNWLYDSISGSNGQQQPAAPAQVPAVNAPPSDVATAPSLTAAPAEDEGGDWWKWLVGIPVVGGIAVMAASLWRSL